MKKGYSPHFLTAGAPPMREEEALLPRLGCLTSCCHSRETSLPLEPEPGSFCRSFSLHPMPVSEFQTVRNGTAHQFGGSLNPSLLPQSTR